MSDARQRAEGALAEVTAADLECSSTPTVECVLALRALLAEQGAGGALHFVCTDFPGPGDECVFVECEDDTGRSINAGEWRRRTDGLVELVVTALPSANPCSVCRRPLAMHRHGGACSCRDCCNRPLPSAAEASDV